jgi:hypothetical protein
MRAMDAVIIIGILINRIDHKADDRFLPQFLSGELMLFLFILLAATYQCIGFYALIKSSYRKQVKS